MIPPGYRPGSLGILPQADDDVEAQAEYQGAGFALQQHIAGIAEDRRQR